MSPVYFHRIRTPIWPHVAWLSWTYHPWCPRVSSEVDDDGRRRCKDQSSVFECRACLWPPCRLGRCTSQWQRRSALTSCAWLAKSLWRCWLRCTVPGRSATSHQCHGHLRATNFAFARGARAGTLADSGARFPRAWRLQSISQDKSMVMICTWYGAAVTPREKTRVQVLRDSGSAAGGAGSGSRARSR